jgi:dUTP pyrophosphatase
VRVEAEAVARSARDRLLIRRLSDHGLPLPEYASVGAAGLDLRAARAHVLEPGRRTLVGTGFAIALPPSCEGQIRPRSGLAARHGVTVLNAPGTVDPDYRGEVKVLLINLGQDPVEIAAGDRIAQLVVAPIARLELVEVEELPETTRGAGGFGSTGR